MTNTTTIEPIRRSITVRRSVADSFRIFTEELATWWPILEHSIGEEKVATALVEGRQGGRIFERWHDGTEYDWGTILVWEPPRRLVVSWNPNPQRTVSTEIEVRFTERNDATHVELEHRAWERLGRDAGAARESYATGWPGVLHRFAQATAA